MCKLRAMLLDGSSLLGKAAVTGQTAFEEIRGDVLEPDFWLASLSSDRAQAPTYQNNFRARDGML